jgi:hypothetical protein
VDCQGAAAIRVLGIVQVAAQLIGLHGSQVFLFGVLIMQAAEFVILPTHDAVFSTGFIPGFDAGMAELRHGDRAADDKILARLNIDTDFDDKIGIQLKIMLVHKAFSFLLARLWIFKIHPRARVFGILCPVYRIFPVLKTPGYNKVITCV